MISTEPITVVGIMGDIGSGKTTTARIMSCLEEYETIHLADPLKGMIDDINGDSRWLTKEIDSMADGHRDHWRTIGNECRQDVENPMVWTSLLLMRIRYLSHYLPAMGGSSRKRFCIPDIRHPEEVAEIRRIVSGKWGGEVEIWLIDGRGSPDWSHSSETSRFKIVPDRVIPNDHTVRDLSEFVREAESARHHKQRTAT